MLRSIQRFFDNLAPIAAQTEAQKQHAIHLSVAVLLVEMCRMDGEVTTEELKRLHQILEKQFQLSKQEKLEITALANQELDDATDYYQFTSVINQHLDQPQKIKMIEQLWQIAFVDEELNPHEEHYLRKISALLHVSHSNLMKTKHKVSKLNSVE